MRIAVVNNCVPFVSGGAEHLAEALTAKLIEHGHSALLVRIPFRWEPPGKIIESMLACRLLQLPYVDRVVGLKFPAYYIPHPNKVLWLLHQFRQAYDLCGTPFQSLSDTDDGRRIREAVVHADNTLLAQARKIFTNSGVTSQRLKKFNGLDSHVLYPPLSRWEHFFCAGYGDFIFYPSRITASKRQHLVVEAMKYVKTAVRLVVAGQAEDPADLERLYRIIQENRLSDRVQVIPRFITEEEKTELFSRALACAYIPYDEDSYGYVTMESYYSRKPVITCSDSGGTDVLVKDGQTGRVVPPRPETIAIALDELFTDRGAARRMGEAGLDLVGQLSITWDHVIGNLTA